MSDTVLIAHRGEIACRIIRTATMVGLRTVAVYSDADIGAPHTSMADEAVHLGGPAPAESYQDIDRVLGAATGAGAVHPGYGFLSENTAFARAVAAATGIGYPVTLEATSGGGGIGLHVCADEAELVAGFERVSRMAAANFGAGDVFVERFVERARHVEVQVSGDGAGTVVSLGDRDCSVRRRNQEVLEEASFLEVNARPQVEHPVTEEISGIDLVAWMPRLARGDGDVLAGVSPDGPPRPGHAVAARVYAEDPVREFQPSAGLITRAEFGVDLVVFGAHLRGQPLNHQLVARFAGAVRTAPEYRMVLTPSSDKPGIIHNGLTGAALPAPMSLGAITLDVDTTAVGFHYTHKVAEPLTDITHHDGWRNFLAGR